MITDTLYPKIKEKLEFLRNFGAYRKSEVLLKNPDISSFQKVFQGLLESHVQKKIASYDEIIITDIANESMRHAGQLLLAGGKRIRPYMCFLAYLTEGGGDQRLALRAGIGLELFHGFALMHDDIIDGGVKRHNLPTTHTFAEQRIGTTTRGSAAHVAEGVAMLAGDLMFSWSNEAIAHLHNEESQEIFFRMCEEVVAGQMLDVAMSVRRTVDIEMILKKNEVKTALYTFVNPMLIGAALAGSSRNDGFYRSFGIMLGQAFQIQDDILDVVGAFQKTGKEGFKDIEEGQHTLLSQYVLERADRNQKEVFLSLFGKPLDDHGKNVLMELFLTTGALEYAQQSVNTLLASARELLEVSSFMDNEIRDRWVAVIDLLDNRKS
jgi:geranylgeranyl diphosphate synthase type I